LYCLPLVESFKLCPRLPDVLPKLRSAVDGLCNSLFRP
jgi:hypothetical protein